MNNIFEFVEFLIYTICIYYMYTQYLYTYYVNVYLEKIIFFYVTARFKVSEKPVKVRHFFFKIL